MLLCLLMNEVLSPLAGLTRGAGEKVGVAKADLYGVVETGSEYGVGTFLGPIAVMSAGTDESASSDCLVMSSTYSRSSMRATMLKARLSRTLE